jgi:hypothetical protein
MDEEPLRREHRPCFEQHLQAQINPGQVVQHGKSQDGVRAVTRQGSIPVSGGEVSLEGVEMGRLSSGSLFEQRG